MTKPHRNVPGDGDQAPEQPESVPVVERRARLMGLTVEALLELERNFLSRVESPTSDCLETHEVTQFLANELPPSRAQHVEVCADCAVLLDLTASPRAEGREKLLGEVRSTSAAAQRPDASRYPRPRVREFLADFASVLTPIALSVATITAYFIFAADPQGPLAEAAFSPGRSLVLVIGSIFGVAGIMLIRFLRTTAIRHSLGALAAGTLTAALAGMALFELQENRTRQFQAALALFGGRVGQAMQVNDATGKFPELQDRDKTLAVSTPKATTSSAQYLAIMKGLEGSFSAEIASHSGNVYWTSDNQRELVARVLSGTVVGGGSDVIVIRDMAGQEHEIKLAGDGTRPENGKQVVAVLEPEEPTASRLYSTTIK